MEDYIVGLDIGTTKICAVIGVSVDGSSFTVLGRGIAPSTGHKKGVIVDIDSTAIAITNAIEQTEESSGVEINSVYASISGINVELETYHNSLEISDESREISKKDVENILSFISNIKFPSDMKIIDVIPRQFIVDGYDEIHDPVGMVGRKLEVEVDVVLGKITSVQNYVKSIEKAGLVFEGFLLETTATSDSILTKEEKELNTLLLDVGGNITDISIYKAGKLEVYHSIPIGGENITSDISVGLKITNIEAEKIKRQYPIALTSLIKNDQEISIFDINENRKKMVKVSAVIEIIQARVNELFNIIKDLLERNGYNVSELSGIVLTGAGISYIDGVIQSAKDIMGVPVRTSNTKQFGNYDVDYLTATGLVKHILINRKSDFSPCQVTVIKSKESSQLLTALKKIGSVFSGFFN